jgi:hypothetical protein
MILVIQKCRLKMAGYSPELARTFVATLPDCIRTVGYYAISTHRVVHEVLPTAAAKGLPRLDVPVVLIGKLAANQKHAKRKFAGIVLVSDNESWVGTGRHGSTGVMTAWEAFVANQRKLAGKEANPKLVCIDLQPYQTVQACERADIMNIGGFSDSVFNVISAFLADNNQRFVAEVEAIEL